MRNRPSVHFSPLSSDIMAWMASHAGGRTATAATAKTPPLFMCTVHTRSHLTVCGTQVFFFQERTKGPRGKKKWRGMMTEPVSPSFLFLSCLLTLESLEGKEVSVHFTHTDTHTHKAPLPRVQPSTHLYIPLPSPSSFFHFHSKGFVGP